MLSANGRARERGAEPKLKHLREWVEHITKQHDAEIKDLPTRVYWVLNGLVEAPRCMNKACNAKLVHKSFNAAQAKQPQYCCLKCSNTCESRIERSQATKQQHAADDPEFWSRAEAKKKAHKAQHGHSPNWVNSQKALRTKAQIAADDPQYYSKIEAKRKLTKQARGHGPNWHNEEQMKATRRKKNNGAWESESTAAKREQTSVAKYGCKSPNSSSIVKQHKRESCMEKYGVDSYSKTAMYHEQMATASEQRKAREHATKKENGTFCTSKPEDRVYEFLASGLGPSNVVRQHRSAEYPFNCDFYIKPLGLYIECNFSWTHGGHWFNPADPADQQKLSKWKSKGTKYYLNAVETWTVRDVKKRRCAEENGLRYFAMWQEDYAALEAAIKRHLPRTF